MAAAVKIASVLWRRLDASGSDVAHWWRTDGGWLIRGVATFLQEGQIAELRYEVDCDQSWVTRSGTVRGWIGARALDIQVTRNDRGEWTMNGERVPTVTGCIDLDLNFTPATNLMQFRRLNMAVGSRADVPVAWFAVPEFDLQVLPQKLHRTSKTTYDYAAPTVGYAGVLEVDDVGWVLRYPELWVAEKVEVFERR